MDITIYEKLADLHKMYTPFFLFGMMSTGIIYGVDLCHKKKECGFMDCILLPLGGCVTGILLTPFYPYILIGASIRFVYESYKK